MKNKRIIAILCGLLIALTQQVVFAQDALILRYRPDTLKVKVYEIGVSEIKYKFWPVDESMPIMAERKDRVRKLILENGTIMRFDESEFVNTANYSNQRKAMVKADLFSILFGTFSASYEQSIEPGKSWEAGLGIIGLGNSNDIDRSGVFFRGGFKFINQPDYYLTGMRYSHIMKGSYIRPEFVFRLYSLKETNTYYDYTKLQTYEHEDVYRKTGGAFLINFGKQWVFQDLFAVDLFAGVGLGIGKTRAIDVGSNIGNASGYNSYDYDYNTDMDAGTGFGLASDEGNVTLAYQFGLKLGVLIGSKDTKPVKQITK